MKRGATVRAWLPFPQTYRQQARVYLVSTTPADGKVAPEETPHRTVYFERKIDSAEPARFSVTFEFATSAWCPKLDESQAKVSADAALKPYLAERPPHIAFTPELRAAVAEAVGGETNPLAKARKIFQWVDSHIAYHAEDEYGIIPSVTQKVLACRRGDCGIQTILFMTMCRYAGISTRWQSGWETQRSKYNMHDWCEFHLEPWGWLPADPSYGIRQHDDPRVREFFIGHMDSYRMIVNSDYGRPLWPAKQSLRSEPVDFQRGEVEVDGRNLYFNQWDWNIDIKWLDEGP
jgi:transglutaminase-like putative cysteine protease